MTEPNPMRLAILIDAENVQPVYADLIFSNAASIGTVTAREIFGAASALTTWVEPVLKYAIHPNLTIKAAKGKNSSDIALVIGAMDLVLGGEIDGVVIASSDSDFSSLSVRLRTAGLEVIGMGTEKANALWRTACSRFMVLEQPSQKAAAQQPAQKQGTRPSQKPAAQQQRQKQPQAQPPVQPPAQKQGANRAQKQPAAQQPSRQAQKAAPATGHRERAAAIEQVIRRQLDANGGRVQVSALFTTLNRLPEYQADRQGEGKKPLNYLTSTFSEVFQFENDEDKIWVSLRDGQPAGEAKAPEALSLPEEAAELPPAEAVPVEEGAPLPEDAPLETPPEEAPIEEAPPEAAEEAPVPESAYEEAQAAEALPDAEPAPAEGDGEVNLAVRLLVEGGMEAGTAEAIVGILSTASDRRAAYNAIRRRFGNIEGRNLYNRAKEILESREQ